MIGFKVTSLRRPGFLVLAPLVLLMACKSHDAGSGKPGAAVAARPTEEELISRWDTLRTGTGDEDITRMARKRLERAAGDTNAFSTVVAAQLLATAGDFKGAKAAADSAAMKFPQEDSPHYFLAKLYYRLAIFDAVDRHVYHMSTLPLSETTKASMDPSTRIDIDELTDGNTTVYRSLLKDVGITEPQTIALRLYLIDPNKVMGPDPRAVTQELIGKLGLPSVFPVITLTPDSRSTEILGWVKRELDAASSRNPTPTPTGVGLIDRTEMAAIRHRVNQFLPTSSAQDQSAPKARTDMPADATREARVSGAMGNPEDRFIGHWECVSAPRPTGLFLFRSFDFRADRTFRSQDSEESSPSVRVWEGTWAVPQGMINLKYRTWRIGSEESVITSEGEYGYAFIDEKKSAFETTISGYQGGPIDFICGSSLDDIMSRRLIDVLERDIANHNAQR